MYLHVWCAHCTLQRAVQRVEGSFIRCCPRQAMREETAANSNDMFQPLGMKRNNSRPTWRNCWFSCSNTAMRRQSALMKEANSTMTTSKQQFQDMKNMIERDLDAKKAGTAQAQNQLLDLVRSGHEWNAWPVWPPISSGLAGNLCFAFQFWLIPIWNGVGNDCNVSLMSWHSEAMKSA